MVDIPGCCEFSRDFKILGPRVQFDAVLHDVVTTPVVRFDGSNYLLIEDCIEHVPRFAPMQVDNAAVYTLRKLLNCCTWRSLAHVFEHMLAGNLDWVQEGEIQDTLKASWGEQLELYEVSWAPVHQGSSTSSTLTRADTSDWLDDISSDIPDRRSKWSYVVEFRVAVLHDVNLLWDPDPISHT